MARPSNATVVSRTPGGIAYQQLVDSYSEKGAADANQVTLQVLVQWQFAAAFLQEVMGFATWDRSSQRLTRTLPLACPLRADLWADSYRLVDCGMYETRSDVNNEINGNTIELDWAIYEIVFLKPKYKLRTDSSLAAGFDGLEKNRFVSFRRRYVPRERRVAFGFEYNTSATGDDPAAANWQPLPEEAAFEPDYTIMITATWWRVPFEAYPFELHADRMLTVNATDFQFEKNGKVYKKESLLFRGPVEEIDWYMGADGGYYTDVPLVFDYRPGKFGWNGYQKRDRTTAGERKYGRVRRKGVAVETPPYPLSNFDDLIKPGA